jgi:hypothetical protein
VKLDTLRITDIVLQGSKTPADFKVVLTSGEVVQQTNGVTASLTLDIKMDKSTDVVALKENVNLFTVKGDSFLSIVAGGVADMIDLGSVIVSSAGAQEVVDYDADNTRDELQSFTLDLGSREIAMTFDAIITISTSKASSIAIQSAAEYGDVTNTNTHKCKLDGSTTKFG